MYSTAVTRRKNKRKVPTFGYNDFGEYRAFGALGSFGVLGAFGAFGAIVSKRSLLFRNKRGFFGAGSA